MNKVVRSSWAEPSKYTSYNSKITRGSYAVPTKVVRQSYTKSDRQHAFASRTYTQMVDNILTKPTTPSIPKPNPKPKP